MIENKNNISEPTDTAIVRQCLNGDIEAFGDLVKRYQNALFNVAYRMVNDHDDAADIIQSVFLKVFENLESYKSQYKFYTWIYRITVNECINFINHRKRIVTLEDNVESDRDNPEEQLQKYEWSQEIQCALMQLKPDHLAVLVLKHSEELSYREIATILEIPEKTVKSRLFSARRELREHLHQKTWEKSHRKNI